MFIQQHAMERTLRSRGINCKCRGIVRFQFIKLWDLSRYSEKGNIQEAYLLKTRILGQFVSEILAHLCSDDSIQILLNLTWFKRLDPSQIYVYWRWVTNRTKQTVKKNFLFFYTRLQKQHNSLTYWLKVCMAKTQCYQF